MPTLRDLYDNSTSQTRNAGLTQPDPLPNDFLETNYNKKETQKQIFDENSKLLIDSQGIINTRRLKALATTQPTAIGSMVGTTVGGLIGGGSAGRPSDTIFLNNSFSPPVSALFPTEALLKDATNIIDPDKSYYVKQHPNNALTALANLGKSLVTNDGTAQSKAIGLINTMGNKTNWSNTFKKNTEETTEYGPKYSVDSRGKIKKGDILYSTHYLQYNENGTTTGLKERETNKPIDTKSNPETGQKRSFKSVYDIAFQTLNGTYSGNNDLQKFLENNEKNLNTPYVMFKIYGDTNDFRKIVLPATVTGISEDVTPTINFFKYVGSPFNLYRYGGVERTIKFDLKLYYTTKEEKNVIKNKLDMLREYSFPDRNLSAITYGDKTNNKYSPITFNPNILQFTINGLYNDLYGIIESLSISIDDNVSWPSFTVNDDGGNRDVPYPSVINVSISMKIIEHPSVEDGKFNYGKSELESNQYAAYFTNNLQPNVYGKTTSTDFSGGGNESNNFSTNNTFG